MVICSGATIDEKTGSESIIIITTIATVVTTATTRFKVVPLRNQALVVVCTVKPRTLG